MARADGDREALRDAARRDDPACATAWADLEAWERAEGFGSRAAWEATRRRDPERWIPGLPARRTYRILGVTAVAAVVVDIALAWAPPSPAIDDLDALIRYGTAGLGVLAAGWSLLSEMRGWEGSDAATWFAKGRMDRYSRALEVRGRALRDMLVAVGRDGIVVYRSEGGGVTREVIALHAMRDISLDTDANHMVLRLTTTAGRYCFEWLARDVAFEASVSNLADLMRVRRTMAVDQAI